MTEYSYPWDGLITGDATLAPYSDDEWSDIWKNLFQGDLTEQGVICGYLNELAVSGVATPLSVASGAALVDGKFYYNSASMNVAIPSPVADTRIDRICLQKDWAARTVRVYRHAGVEGGAAPTLTQNDGTTWEIPLYQASITTLGAVTLTDERRWCRNRTFGPRKWIFKLPNPTNYYNNVDTQILIGYAERALTIKAIRIWGPDSTPTSEMAGDLKHATSPQTWAGATVIDVCDTTSGTFTVTSGMDDPTIPAGSFVYFQFDSAPHVDWLWIWYQIEYQYD